MTDIMPCHKTNERARVLAAQGQMSIAHDLSSRLAKNGEFEILPNATDGAQAIEFARRYRPDVILIDLHLTRIDGVAATRHILREFPQINIVVLTTCAADHLIYEAISAGAMACLLHDATIDEVVMTVRLVMNGQSWFSPTVAARIIEEFRRLRRVPATATPRESLTARENEVIKLVAEGKSNTEIAARLHLCEGTVKNYVSSIMEKCQAKNRTELAIRSVIA